MASSNVDFQLFDADNHYYEATDAFTRHLDPKLAKRTMQWAEINGKQRLLVGGRLNRFIPNPTFDPVARPARWTTTSAARRPATTSAPRSATSSRSALRTASPRRGSR